MLMRSAGFNEIGGCNMRDVVVCTVRMEGGVLGGDVIGSLFYLKNLILQLRRGIFFVSTIRFPVMYF